MVRNSFRSNDSDYDMNVSIMSQGTTYGTDDEETYTDVLNTENILEFTYENQMNSLVPMAMLTYVDKEGVVDRYITYPYVKVNVDLVHVSCVKNGDIEIRKPIDGERIHFDLLVNNVEIAEYKPSEITYVIHLVGSRSLELQRICQYTSYPEGKRITDQIKDVLGQADFPIYGKSFDECASNVIATHITNGSDTVYDTIMHLQRKQFYSASSTDDTLKMLVYDDRTQSCSLFDMDTNGDWQTERSFTVTSVKNESNILEAKEGNSIAFVTNKPNTEQWKSFQPKKLKSYNIEDNSFGDRYFESQLLINLFGSGSNKVPVKESDRYETTQSYWNNSQDIYHEQMENMIFNSGLKINVNGVVGIVPGDVIGIKMKVKQEDIEDEGAKKAEVKKATYDSFSGKWYASRVVYKIRPLQCVFRLVISMMRSDEIDILGK